MSTVKAINFQHPSATAVNAATTSGGDLTNAAGVSFMGGSKNLLYNGACQISQRSTSVASMTTGGYYTADRWNTGLSSLGTWTQTVENDAPTSSGLRKSVKMLCTTSSASPAAGAFGIFQQILEGQDLQRIAKGTASAQQLTVSFWVKSNVTGTYVVQLEDIDNNRSVSASYTISASATWEKKTVTFPADTTGAFDNDNAASLYVEFWLGAGSTYTSGTLGTTWGTTTSANRAPGQTNLAAATNNYWQITGVQLEVGPVATSFEFKSYGQELAECERYFQRFTGYSSSEFFVPVSFYLDANTICFPLQCNTMRDAPVVTYSGTANTDYKVLNNGSPQSGFTFTYQKSTLQGTVLTANKTSHGVPNVATVTLAVFPSGAVNLSAEL